MPKIDHLTPRRRWLALALLGGAACAAACSDASTPLDGSGPGPKTKAESFESDLPASSSSKSGNRAGAGTADSSSSAPTAGNPASAGSNEAQRAIVEADIIQVSGDRLYALSRVAGLTVVDLTNPAQLSILGRYRELNGTPFEMYLRDGVVLAMYSSWGQYTKLADGNYSWVQTSKIVALDVKNPAAIATVGSFDVAGEVSDSRMVGDVMYVVGYQNGYCWGCSQIKPQTTIVSLDVKDPRAVHKVDELAYGDANNSYGWNKRSVTVTTDRMYVAGPEYGQSMPTGSTIQVVDISNPGGDMVEGASILATGQISSRWQMDEYQGVLRVISQPPTWWSQGGPTTQRPTVQTFKVESSQKLSPLGTTPIVIPPNEQLNTVRFDGARGYAITSERRDPLFTIDLSDPANPRQVGQVEMPGWIYHLEPRGNRLIGLGYDQGNVEGAITVSVFDVTDLATPKLLDRVNFGGDWAQLPEDQDRIHKAFRILPDLGLVLVPFSGWSRSKESSYCYSNYRSGVQLVDMVGDDLTLRGAVPSRGEARRAFVHNANLLTVSDEAVDSYDFTNRDQPATLGRLSVARNVSHALPLANQTVARINEDWYNGQNSSIDIVALADVDQPERSLGELNLSALVASGTGCNTYAWIDAAFARGNQINVSYQRWDYSDNSGGKGTETQVRGVLSIDASDAQKPVVLSKLEDKVVYENYNYWSGFYNYYQYGYGSAQTNSVRTDNAVVFLEQRWLPSTGTAQNYEMRLRIVDLTDPAHPSQNILMLPKAGGYSGLVVDGANVMLSHFDESASGRARFYLDRVDLSQPASPKLTKVNVPGSLLHYDRAHDRMLTSELVRTVVDDVTSEVCYARFSFADFVQKANDAGVGIVVARPSPGTDAGVSEGDAGVPVPEPLPVGKCTGYTQKLHLVHFVDGGAARDDTYTLGERERLTSSSIGDGRVAAIVSHGYQGWYGVGAAIDCFDCGRFGYGYGTTEPVELLTLGGFDTGHLTVGRLSVANLQDPWWGFWGAPPIYAFGTRALVRGQTDAVVIELTDPTAPTITRKVPLFGSPTDLQASGNLVLLSLGMNGVQRIDL